MKALRKLFEWLWDYEPDLEHVSINPLVKERYERPRWEELGGLQITE